MCAADARWKTTRPAPYVPPRPSASWESPTFLTNATKSEASSDTSSARVGPPRPLVPRSVTMSILGAERWRDARSGR
ncbi:hypothetical protein AMK13_01750 [Streptomyces sp. CB02056]|nr:hypothetical protein AMK13_01750 [Streptomyces sp. CB02056]